MKNRLKNSCRLSAALCLLLALCLCLSACGSQGSVRDNVALSDLAAAIEADISESEGLVDPGDSYIAGSMKLNTSELGEYIIKISSYGTNINEYGLFKAASTDEAKALVQTLEDYLQMRNEAWMPEYLPDQYPKLENAEVEQEGLYVLYAILDANEREAVFNTFSDMLTA